MADELVPPASGTGAAWDPGLDAPIVDLLKSKGMYDDPLKGMNGLAKSYYELNRLQSGASDVVGIPGVDAKPEDWAKVHDKWRPKTPADYGDVFKFPEGVTMGDNVVEFGKKLFHMVGVPKALVPGALAEWAKFASETAAMHNTSTKTANDTAVTEMKTKIGPEIFDGKVALAQTALKSMEAAGSISKETIGALEGAIGTKAVLEIMFAIGQGMKEGAVIGNGNNVATPTNPAEMTPEQANTAMAALRKDEDFQKKYTDPKHAEHKVAVERMLALAEAATRKAA